jgi:protein ImuB
VKRCGLSRSHAPNSNEGEHEIQQIIAILHKWGIHTLGQLVALDKEQLGARLGPEAVRMWERANGQSNRPLKLIRPPELFEESFEFENEIETAEPLLFMLRRFLEQLAVRLSGIYFVAKELTLRITFTNKQQYERCFKIPQSTNDVDLLFRMLQTHLENFKSDHPIIAVSLQAHPIKPNSQQFGLFETTLRNLNQLSETLARLTALLGVDRVGTPVLDETHRPDAFHIEPFSWEAVESAVPSGEPPDALRTAHTTTALRRFRPAVAASVFLSENIPAHLRSANPFGCRSGQANGKVAEQRGPYLASGNWWDKTAWACAEWDLQLENAVLLRCHQSGETWEMDGIYD